MEHHDTHIRSAPARHYRTALIAAAVALAYYGGAQLGFVLRFPPATTSVIWPPNAFLTAVLLLTPPRRWWAYLAAALPAHLLVEFQAGFPAPMVLALFLTNCSEALIAAAIVHRFSDSPARFDTLSRAVVFVAGAVFLAPFLSSFPDAATVSGLRGEAYGLVLRRRLLSNALSELTLVPSLVIGLREGLRWVRASRPRRRLEAGLLALALVAVAGALFTGLGGVAQLPGAPYTSLPLLMPFLVWAALRFGPGGASLSLLVTALLAIGAALSGRRPFSMLSTEESVAALQVFVLVVGVPLLLLSALLEERRQAAQALAERLRFEELLSRVSAAFVHPSSDGMNVAFETALRHLGEALQVDRVALRELSNGGQHLELQCAWPRAPSDFRLREPTAGEPDWATRRVLRDEIVAVSRLDDFPPEAEGARERHRRQGVRASLTFPLVAGGRVLGCLTFASATERPWPDLLVDRWRLVADVLASALARKQTEEALRAGEAMKSAILASLTSQVAVLDRDGRIVTVNESWARLMGEADAAPAEALGAVDTNFLERWRLLASGGVPEAEVAVAGVQGVLDGSRPAFLLEYRRPSRGRERWFVMTVVPLRDAPEGGAVVSLSEVTERRLAEAEAQSARQELAHYLRVSTIGELTTSLAHQLNQPLAAILANAQAARRCLEARPADPRELLEILTDIVDEDKRAGEVIAGLRTLLRKGGGERAALEVNGLVGEVSRLLGSEVLIRKATLHFEPHPTPLTVIGDRVQIQQVILNLLVNAIDAAAEREDDDRVVVVRTERTDAETARISVQDSGPGLSDDRKDRVFEPFFTTKPSGMGRGLPIARSIVEAHGGTILAANNPDRGATFAVVLPLVHEAPA
jgi:signal transduction histidine kinase/integral membrane sensor domain MASE1